MSLLLLEGPSGVGKSTLIYQYANRSEKVAGGFYCQRLRDERGDTRAFCLRNANGIKITINKYFDSISNIFLEFANERIIKHLQVFENISEIVGDVSNCDYFLLDEIGGMELAVPSFLPFLRSILDTGKPCIGVLKSSDLYLAMHQHLNETPCLWKNYQDFRSELIHHYHANIILMEQRESAQAKREVAYFFQQLFL